MSISGRIRGLCEQKGITINRLEKESGVGRGAIVRWDAHSPSAEKVSAVADYFGVTTDYLLTGEQKEPPPTPEGEGLDAEFMRLFQMLTPEQQARELAYLRELTGGRGN